MLTKQDLEAIDKVVAKRTEPIKKGLADFREEFNDHKSGVQSSLILLRAEISNELGNVKRRLREIKNRGSFKIP